MSWRAVVAAIALGLLACGHYGPPRRTGGEPVPPQTEQGEDDERKERDR